MGFLADRWAATGTWTAPSVSDDGAWTTQGTSPSYAAQSGAIVTQGTALRISAVWACYKILTEALAQLPCILYERHADGRSRSQAPLASILAAEPNYEQSAFEFFEQMQGYALFRKFAHAEIKWDGDTVRELIPLHPDRVRRRALANGTRRFEYLEDDGTTWRPILDDAMLRVPGTPVLDFARDSFGMAMALEQYAAKSFARGVRPSGFIAQDPTTEYSEDARTNIKARIEEEHGGSENANGVLWLPQGLKWNQIGMTNEQAQFVGSRAFTVADISRWFRVPPYMLSLLEAGTVSYASVSQQSLDFMVFTVMPWLTRWEQALGRSVIHKPDMFAEFLTASMLRGTTKERYDVYAIALAWGVMSVNEIRRLENLDPRKGGDAFLVPLNMSPAQDTMDAGSPAANLLASLTADAAGRVVSRETRALPKLLEKGDEAVAEFYESHTAYVTEALHMPAAAAESYVEKQRKAAVDVGTWDTDALISELSAMTGVTQ